MTTTTHAPQLTSLSNTPIASQAERSAPDLPDDERALLEQVALQDQHAFAALYRRYAPQVRRYLMRRLAQTDCVDDVLQEVMLVLWQRPSACPPVVPLPAWLCGIARHKAHKALARLAAPVLSPQPCDIDMDDPERLALCHEQRGVLERALDTLPFYERTVLVLLMQQGCSYEDIATRMDTPVSTVRTRISRAHQRLRILMAPVEQ